MADEEVESDKQSESSANEYSGDFKFLSDAAEKIWENVYKNSQVEKAIRNLAPGLLEDYDKAKKEITELKSEIQQLNEIIRELKKDKLS